LWCICLCGIVLPGFAQDSTTTEKALSFIAGAQHGFIFAHSPDVQNTKGARPTGIELSVAWQKNNPSTWDLCNCFPQTGFVFSYYDYNSKILGKSITATYFLEPMYRLGRNTFFSFKAVAGLIYLTNPFDSIHNPTNQSYSTNISGYLSVGAGLWLRLNDHWRLNAGIRYQHSSNGGLKQPNKGINFPTAGIAVSYQPKPMHYNTGARSREKFWKDDPLRWDAGLFGMGLKAMDKNGNNRRRLMLGISAQASKQVGRINALTLGIEAFKDNAVRTRLERDSIDASAIRAGFLAGHEFLLGKFLFSQRIGVYIFDESPYYDRIYHRWGIHYRINKHWGMGLHLLAHRHVADFVDARVTYTMQK
jgi:hypothetical protein